MVARYQVKPQELGGRPTLSISNRITAKLVSAMSTTQEVGELETHEARIKLYKLIKKFSRRRSFLVLKLLYGLGPLDGHQFTLRDIGKILHVTIARVRQLQNKAEQSLYKSLIGSGYTSVSEVADA